MQPFLVLLQLQRARQKLSMQELADRLGLKSHSYVAEIINGRKPLPLESVEAWANALKFEDKERIELYHSAIADLGPRWLATVVIGARDKIDQLEARISEFEQRIVQDWKKGRVAEGERPPA